MRSISWLVTSYLILCSAPLAAQQVLTVSPVDRTTVEGSSFTHFPLGRANTRMQTLHRDVPGGTLLSGHAYRRDAVGVRGQVDAFTCDLAVTLSLSPNLPTQVSTAFANNVGSAPVAVLPRTVLAFPATQRPGLDPAPAFELTIPYQVPFLMPAGTNTLCVDVQIFGNGSAAGTNQNLSIYLDAHEQFADGRTEAAGFRTGQGCVAPGQTAACYANLSLWRLATGNRLDVSVRNGVLGNSLGSTRAFVTLGLQQAGAPWPTRPDCPFWSSAEVWFPLSGTTTATGDYDGSLTNLPTLPPGFRLWCQAGTIDLATVGMSFSDAVTLVTPALGSVPIPVSRVANSTDHTAATGTVSYAVPVMAFF